MAGPPFVFPFGFIPSPSYSNGGRRFGARRNDGRLHAACDLIAPRGTEIFAVTAGTVTRGPYAFYHGTEAIEVNHGTFVARYCEIDDAADGVSVGSTVEAGQVIAHVGQMYHSSMLHFEMYAGTAVGGLTNRRNPPYQRRSDLLDPTPYLNTWLLTVW